jgi:hypothetical protein
MTNTIHAYKIHAFNTGAWYTEKGQRIAWTVLSTGNIAMLDIDRGIDYVLPRPVTGTPTNAYVHHMYLTNQTLSDSAEYWEARDLEDALRAAARAVPPNAKDHVNR